MRIDLLNREKRWSERSIKKKSSHRTFPKYMCLGAVTTSRKVNVCAKEIAFHGLHIPSVGDLQALTNLDIRKAPLVTTGIPGQSLDGMDAIADMTEDRSSPKSRLTSLTSIESPTSSQRTPDQPHLKGWGPDWSTISKELGSNTSTDSELRRSLRNHGTDEKKVGLYAVLLSQVPNF